MGLTEQRNPDFNTGSANACPFKDSVPNAILILPFYRQSVAGLISEATEVTQP